MKLKLISLALTSLALTLSSQSHAAIALPNEGDSELILVMTNQNATNPDVTTFVLDLGIRGYDFNPNLNQSFTLSANPIYNEWKTTISSPSNPYFFAVIGADALGTPQNRALWTTSSNSSLRGIATDGSLNNNFVSGRTAALNPMIQGHNDRVPTPGVSNSTHQVRTNPSLPYDPVTNPYVFANGASWDTIQTGQTSAFFQLTWENGWNAKYAQVGQKAEFFRVNGVAGSNTQRAIITDFFSDVETATNPGGFWSIANDVLTYTAAPTAPVPEASEWAMMLGGLGLVGFFTRRRQQKQAA